MLDLLVKVQAWMRGAVPEFMPALALLMAIVAILLVLMLKRMVVRKLTALQRNTSQQPTRDQSAELREEIARTQRALEEMQAIHRDYREQSRAACTAINDIVKVLGDSRAQEVLLGEQHGSGERFELLQFYQTTRLELAPFNSTLSALAAPVSTLGACPTLRNSNTGALIRTVVQKYGQMQGVDSELASKIAQMGALGHDSAEALNEARRGFESGSLTADAYLRQVYSMKPAEKVDLPDLSAEQGRYGELIANKTEVFLNWLDRVNELREAVAEWGGHEIASGCTQIIRQSRPVLDPLDVQIDDVEIGRTQYDARLHELLHTVPRPGTRPETVVGVHQLGSRRGGKTICKPQVVVAAAGI